MNKEQNPIQFVEANTDAELRAHGVVLGHSGNLTDMGSITPTISVNDFAKTLNKIPYAKRLGMRLQNKRQGGSSQDPVRLFPQYAGQKGKPLTYESILEQLGVKKIDANENITTWEQLNDMYAHGISMMVATMSIIREIPKDQLAAVKDQNALIMHLRQMTIDARAFKGELLEVEKHHMNKTGPIENPDDSVLAFEINIKYITIIERFTGLMTNSMLEMMTMINQGLEAQHQSAAEGQLPAADVIAEPAAL